MQEKHKKKLFNFKTNLVELDNDVEIGGGEASGDDVGLIGRRVEAIGFLYARRFCIREIDGELI